MLDKIYDKISVMHKSDIYSIDNSLTVTVNAIKRSVIFSSLDKLKYIPLLSIPAGVIRVVFAIGLAILAKAALSTYKKKDISQETLKAKRKWQIMQSRMKDEFYRALTEIFLVIYPLDYYKSYQEDKGSLKHGNAGGGSHGNYMYILQIKDQDNPSLNSYKIFYSYKNITEARSSVDVKLTIDSESQGVHDLIYKRKIEDAVS